MEMWKKIIQEMIDWIEENIEERPNLIKMSEVIGYSPCYCSHLFHEVTGMTLKHYLAGRRLFYATLALRDTNERIIDVALRYGYSSQEALTRAFAKNYGCTPYAYRKNPGPLPLPMKQNVLFPEDYMKLKQGGFMMGNLKDAQMRFEYIPAHKYIGIWDKDIHNYCEFFAKYNCDEITGTVESMRHVAHEIVGPHMAGWFKVNGERGYFYGVGVPLDYNGEIPKGFQIKEIPATMYMKFFHPAFDYLQDNNEVMKRVEDLAWNFKPEDYGYTWNEEVCQDYQIHFPEVVGYQILRPVKKL